MLGIYVHIPFCVKKCHYCDFVSVEGADGARRYVEALISEAFVAGQMYRQKVDSIFVGGGTPGLLAAGYISEIMAALRECFVVENNAEITIETNPCVVTPEKLAEYRDVGINRISIGMQAAQDRLLTMLGRQHSAQQFGEAYELARRAGFENINVDMIYALPTQTPEEWEETLYQAVYLRPEHVSAYALKIEEGTPFGRMAAEREMEDIDEDTDAEMYRMARRILMENGYGNYEVSNFAREGYECRHNLKYWSLYNYLGLGVAAHSNIERLRFANTEDIDEYIRQMERGGLRYTQSDFIEDEERQFEFVMLRMRLADGFAFGEFRRRFGFDYAASHGEQMKKAVELGLAEADDVRIRPTEKGFMLQNRLVHILTG